MQKRSELTVFDLLTLMEEGVPCPAPPNATPEWLARQAAGVKELGTLPRMCQLPFAVIGYTMMIRGESFRSDRRVPTHMVNHMSAAMSIDRIVQSAGRATFQGADFLERNKFDGVSVLMLKHDYDTVRAYMRLMDQIKERIVKKKQSVAECFGEDAEPYSEDLWVLLDPSQKRRIGNLRECHTRDIIPVRGAEERLAAAREEAARELREKQEKREAEAAARAAKAGARAEKKRVAAEAAAVAAADRLEKKQKRDAEKLLKKRKGVEGDEGGASGDAVAKRPRKQKTLADSRKWALDAQAALRAGGEAASVPNSKLGLRVLRCGTLRPEPAFLRIRTKRAAVAALIPVGYRSTRKHNGATYVQEVQLGSDSSGQPAPKFVVWRATSAAETAPAPADAWEADGPGAVWELVLMQVSAEAAAAGGARGASPADAMTPEPAAPVGCNTPTTPKVTAAQGVNYFGLDSRDVRALLELQPGLEACRNAETDKYVTLDEEEAQATPEPEPEAAQGGGAFGEGGAGFATPLASVSPAENASDQAPLAARSSFGAVFGRLFGSPSSPEGGAGGGADGGRHAP